MQKPIKSLNRILKYLVAAVLLAVPLYPKFPFIRVPGIHVSIRLEDLLIAVLAVILLLIIIPNIRKIARDKVNRAIGLFLIVGLISLASAIFVTKTIVPHIGLLHWARRVEYFIPFFAGVLAIRNKRSNLEFFLKVLMITFIYAAVFGLGQRYLSWPIILTQSPESAKGVALRWVAGSHINSTFAGHYDLGTFQVFLLPVFISLFFLLKEFRAKLALFVVISGGLWLLSYSGSRISVVSYLLAGVSALVLTKKYKAIPLMIIFSLIFFSFSPSLRARYSRIIEVTVEKVKGMSQLPYTQNRDIVLAAETGTTFPQRRKAPTPTPAPPPVFEDRSTSIRLNVEWPRAVRALSKNPLLGTGYSSITLATDNGYLRLLGEVGILGFLAFSLVFLRIGKLILSSFPLVRNFESVELGFLAGVVGALPGVFLNAVFLDIFEASKFAIIFWLIMGFTVGLVYKKEYEQNN
jgi:hypothetical protein